MYIFANQLAFLRDVIRPRPTDASIETMDPFSPNHENDSASETQSGLDKPVHVAKKRKGNVVEKRLMEALENHNLRQKEKSESIKNESKNVCEDDDKLFLLSLLPFLKSISPHFKLSARIDSMQSINKFIIVQIPAPPPIKIHNNIAKI